MVVLFLASGCGGHATVNAVGHAGSGGAEVALVGAPSGATAAGGVASGSGGMAGVVGDAGSGVVAECPPPNSSSSDYRALDGKGCSDVGVVCSRFDCTVDCHCETTSGPSRWHCVKSVSQCGPPK